MNNILIPHNLHFIYNTFMSKKKERFDIIVEPLQAILQLALLRFSPVGTKITIQNNLLELQFPNYIQGIVRWYNNDNKEDLYYLFNACKRFGLFYNNLQNYKSELYMKNDEIIETNLYNLLIECAKDGLSRLAQTYSNIDKVSLLHTLQMYKVILDNPNFFESNPSSKTITPQNTPPFKPMTPVPIKDKENKKDSKKENKNVEKENEVIEKETNNREKTLQQNIDSIFINIREIYSKEELYIIHNVLHMLINAEEDDCYKYIEGLNLILKTTNMKIKKWINDNIVY